jgi:hypothetical protein
LERCSAHARTLRPIKEPSHRPPPTTFPQREKRAQPRSPPHQFFAARAKPTAPEASTCTTAPVGVFIITRELP